MPQSVLTVALILTLAFGASGCALRAVSGSFPETTALAPTSAGTLSAVASRVRTGLDGDDSALWLLDRADYSLEARLAVIDRASRSLDIQYFIWEKDASSRLFAHRIALAAERGVRVRILLDDLTLSQQDGEYHGLSQHPNIEIRSFNPWNRRTSAGRVAEFMVRFGHLNHRMHNKVIVADGHFAIVGGRNIGDRYFGLWDDFVQNDLDVMAVGPVVDAIIEGFDWYWSSRESFPLSSFIRGRDLDADYRETLDAIIAGYRSESDRLAKFPLEIDSWNSFLDELTTTYLPGQARYVIDDPEVARRDPIALVAPLNEFLEQAEESVLISSPYMVPDDEFMALLGSLVSRGVAVTVLTNSLASNNHMIAHSAYALRRRELLRLGVELYESRADSAALSEYTTPPATPAFLGLHTKGIVVDGRYSYIGSANIDPRSLILNTELALFIEGEAVAEELAALIRRDIEPDQAWRVTLEGKRRLVWSSSRGTVRREPAQGFRQRIAEFFISLLPIKEQS